MADYTARDATILTLIGKRPNCSERIFERLLAAADTEETRTVARKIRTQYFSGELVPEPLTGPSKT